MTGTPIQELERELQDPGFRKLYGAAEAKAELALALALARQKLGLTQKELANLLGVKQPYIAKLESGEANPTIGAVGSMLAQLRLRILMTTGALSGEEEGRAEAGRVPVATGTMAASKPQLRRLAGRRRRR